MATETVEQKAVSQEEPKDKQKEKENLFATWDSISETIDGRLRKKPDVLMALTHFMMVKHGQFRCLGLGEDKTMREKENRSELLPPTWSQGGNKYVVRYDLNGTLYLLMGNVLKNMLLIHLLNVSTRKVTNVAFDPNVVVKGVCGSIKNLIQDVTAVAERIMTQLIKPYIEPPKRSSITPRPPNTPSQSNSPRPSSSKRASAELAAATRSSLTSSKTEAKADTTEEPAKKTEPEGTT